jgi:hypothetical protein
VPGESLMGLWGKAKYGWGTNCESAVKLALI